MKKQHTNRQWRITTVAVSVITVVTLLALRWLDTDRELPPQSTSCNQVLSSFRNHEVNFVSSKGDDGDGLSPITTSSNSSGGGAGTALHKHTGAEFGHDSAIDGKETNISGKDRLILRHTKRDGVLVVAELTKDAPASKFRLVSNGRPEFECSLGVSIERISPSVWLVEMQNPVKDDSGGASVEIYGCNSWITLDFSDAPGWCHQNCIGLDGLQMNHGVVRAFVGRGNDFLFSLENTETESTASGLDNKASSGGAR